MAKRKVKAQALPAVASAHTVLVWAENEMAWREENYPEWLKRGWVKPFKAQNDIAVLGRIRDMALAEIGAQSDDRAN